MAGQTDGSLSGRSNTGAWIGRMTDEVVAAVERRIALVTATSAEWGEDMQARMRRGARASDGAGYLTRATQVLN